MKKFVALLSAGIMLCSTMTAFAASSPSASAVLATAVSSHSEDGFRAASDASDAQERGMSAAEFYNNAVVETPGISNAVPLGQGGKIMINGVATNLTAMLSKVNVGVVSSASSWVSELGGSLLNVVKVDFPGANYSVATINFYLKGLDGAANVAVKQYVGGTWVDVEVVEVRADHVVLNLKNSGAVAFAQLP